jgi:hypothetical protein
MISALDGNHTTVNLFSLHFLAVGEDIRFRPSPALSCQLKAKHTVIPIPKPESIVPPPQFSFYRKQSVGHINRKTKVLPFWMRKAPEDVSDDGSFEEPYHSFRMKGNHTVSKMRVLSQTSQRAMKNRLRRSSKLGPWAVTRGSTVGADGTKLKKISYTMQFTHEDASKPGWSQFVSDCLDELKETNKKLPIGREGGQWAFNQSDDALVFTDQSGKVYAKSTDVVVAGSYSNSSRTWMWGWNNPSIRPELTVSAKPAVEGFVLQNLFCPSYPTFFGLRVVPCAGEGDGWGFAALMNKVLEGVGVYRGPNGQNSTFFVMKNILTVE